MKDYKIIGALLEGILFAVLMWIGDKYILSPTNFLKYFIFITLFHFYFFVFQTIAPMTWPKLIFTPLVMVALFPMGTGTSMPSGLM